MTPDVTEVRVLRPFALDLTFSDGLRGSVDLEAELDGSVFEALRDPVYFEQVRVDEEVGTIVWPNGADFSPEFLYSAVVQASTGPVATDPRSGSRL